MPPRPRKPKPELTTAQRLAAIIKSARDIMRVDAGLNGDLDRIPQLAWLLFLKAFDDLEDSREITDSDFSPVIPKQWRWRTWAGNRKLTGSDLIDFVNGDLLPGLRNLAGTAATRSQADVVKAIFNGMDNRMRSGAQLRLLVDSLDQIHFNSSDDIHTMAFLYESMLREMRDAAGDSGEFYTPRPLIRFMVQRSAPKQGEKVLDPAAGTGGFLVEALTELEPRASSVAKRRALHKNVQGVEKKPLPYLLGTMNLLLHGVDEPVLVMENALRYLRDGSTRTQVDLILTNPPFGGAETKEIIATFPQGQQAAETTWLFLVTILEKLKPRGRCAVVVPNSVLFDTGVTASGIKKKLMDTCDLHTILRLPEGVFAPYTPIPANVLFFEKGRKSDTVWFYEILPPEGQKRYSKTKPMRDEEFAEASAWWGDDDRSGRVGTERAWSVAADELRASGYNLDMKNPFRGNDLAHRSPEELVKELLETEREMLVLLEELEQLVAEGPR